MTIELGALGVASGVVAGAVTHIIGKSIVQKAVTSYFSHPKVIKYGKEISQVLGPSLVGSAVFTALNHSPFTVGLKIGMIATSGFLESKDGSEITRKELLDAPLIIPNIQNEVRCRFALGCIFSVVGGNALLGSSILRGYPQCFSYMLTNLLAYGVSRQGPEDHED